MLTPKEYLRSIGVETGGRGRMPADHVAKVKAAVASGIAIKGYEASTPRVSSTSTAPSEPVVTRAAAGASVYDVSPPLRDEHVNKAMADGRNVGMRAICQGCGNSLTYCPCKSPTVFVDHDRMCVVEFVSTPHTPIRWW